MALSAQHGVRLSQTSPAFLHANSTSHTWIFSAIAELVDNAYDPDVNASNLLIDKKVIGDQMCLLFTDDGNGCAPDKLHKMLSFGYCEKIDIKGHRPIGHYGNGFKSGSMRLGKDALVLTKHGKTMSVGFLSQTFLEAIGSETVLVPIVTWEKRPLKLVDAPDAIGSLDAVLTHSLFHTVEEIMEEFTHIRSGMGTRIIIYNLKRGSDSVLELDFESDKLDMINSEHQELDFAGGLMSRPIRDHMPEYRRSLREYLSILFLKPKMKITLRGCRVKTKLIRKSLRKTRKTTYTPSWMLAQGKKGVEIIFGFGPSKQDYGCMMYHSNRLIKAYERVGVQKQANEMGVGVVAVAEFDFLEPVHNKQDFSKTDRYNACISALGIKLNQYWNAVTGNADSAPEFLRRPDWTWVQCEQCLKWRRLPDELAGIELPEKWYCYMNPDMSHNRCDINEEPENEDEVFKLVVSKNNTKQTKKNFPPIPAMIENNFGRGRGIVSGQMIFQAQPVPTMPPPPPAVGRGRGRGAHRQMAPRIIAPVDESATTTQEVKEEFIPTHVEGMENGDKNSTGTLKVKMFSGRGKKRDVIRLDSDSGSDSDSDGPSKRKKNRYKETKNSDGFSVLELGSSDEDFSDMEDSGFVKKEEPASGDEDGIVSIREVEGGGVVAITQVAPVTPAPAAAVNGPSSSTQPTPSTSGRSKTSTTSVEPDTSSSANDKEPAVKTEAEMLLSDRLAVKVRELEEANTKLSSLRKNIQTLLKILVPTLDLDDPELVDRVVVEMINVNAESAKNSSGSGEQPGTSTTTSKNNVPKTTSTSITSAKSTTAAPESTTHKDPVSDSQKSPAPDTVTKATAAPSASSKSDSANQDPQVGTVTNKESAVTIVPQDDTVPTSSVSDSQNTDDGSLPEVSFLSPTKDQNGECELSITQVVGGVDDKEAKLGSEEAPIKIKEERVKIDPASGFENMCVIDLDDYEESTDVFS